MTEPSREPSQAEIRAFITESERLRFEQNKWMWRTCCELEAGDVDRAKTSVATVMALHEEALLLGRVTYGGDG